MQDDAIHARALGLFLLALAQDDGVVVGEFDPDSAQVRLRDAEIVAHDYKALPRLTMTPAEDTMLAAYLIEPGRPAYEIDDLADTISDELFGDAINAGNIAQLRQTHKELLKQREEVERGTPKWKILTGEIAENEQRLFDLQLQMKKKEGPRAVIAWLIRQRELYGDASGRIHRRLPVRKHMRIVRAIWEQDAPGLLRRVSVPTLVLAVRSVPGVPDPAGLVEERRRAARAVREIGPPVRFEWIEGIHDVPLQRPVAVAHRIIGSARRS